MASLSRLSDGRYRLQFINIEGKRRSIRPGKISEAGAKRLKTHVELILQRTRHGEPFDPDTKAWLETINDSLYAKLAAAELVPPREQSSAADVKTLSWFLDYYFSIRTDVKDSTLIVWGQTKRLLLDFFGEDKSIEDISGGDTEEWRLFLKEQKLSETTIRKRCQFAKQFFSHAKKKGFVAENPFADLKSANLANPKRYFFLSRDDAEKVFDACPDANWRLLFALARFGGLRVPSEPAQLKWEDVSWEHSRITITSPKTEHHPGGESRIIPLFPELRPYLEDRLELEPDSVYVLPSAIRCHTNPGTMLRKIVKRAGLKPWPKLWQNLRSTRQTELSEEFPAHVVCAWIGNTEEVAKLHYLQVTDDHFERAVEAEAVQKVTQQGAEIGRNGSQPWNSGHEKTPVFQGFQSVSTNCDVQKWRIGDSNP